jgi:3-hydroxyacyl-CoA dehydrogenase
MLSDDEHARAVRRLAIAESLAEAVDGVQFVQESVAERYDAKKDVFGQVDRLTGPAVILASSSSGLLISELQEGMERPERSLIAHPFNPPHLIPLVELVPGERTDRAMVSDMSTFFEQLGKIPVTLNREIPGHIANRLQAAVWREAIDLVLKGVASVADVDRALYAGPGLRWALLGAHMIFHLGGGTGGIEHFVDHIGSSWDALWEDMARWTELPADSREALARGIVDEMAGRTQQDVEQWRDEKVAALLQVVYGDRGSNSS